MWLEILLAASMYIPGIHGPMQGACCHLVQLTGFSESRVRNIIPPDVTGCATEPPVTGYTAWFDARDVDGDSDFTDQVDAAAVSQWIPKGTVGDNVLQTTGANKPTLDNDCISTDGEWCVYFDGGDHLVGSIASSWDFLNPADDFSLFVLSDIDAVDGIILQTSSGGANPGLRVIVTSEPTVYVDNHDNVGLYSQVESGVLSLPQSAASVYSTAADFGTSTSLYVDGSLAETVAQSAASATGGTTPLKVGGTGGANPFEGNLMQVLFYGRLLSTLEREMIESWLACVGGNQ